MYMCMCVYIEKKLLYNIIWWQEFLFQSHWSKRQATSWIKEVQAHILATDSATYRVAAVWRSLAAFQALAMRFTARVWFPGTDWAAMLLFVYLVSLIIVPLGKRMMPTASLALCDCAAVSLRLRRPAFWRGDSEDTISLRLVFAIVRATDLSVRFIELLILYACHWSATRTVECCWPERGLDKSQ